MEVLLQVGAVGKGLGIHTEELLSSLVEKGNPEGVHIVGDVDGAHVAEIGVGHLTVALLTAEGVIDSLDLLVAGGAGLVVDAVGTDVEGGATDIDEIRLLSATKTLSLNVVEELATTEHGVVHVSHIAASADRLNIGPVGGLEPVNQNLGVGNVGVNVDGGGHGCGEAASIEGANADVLDSQHRAGGVVEGQGLIAPEGEVDGSSLIGDTAGTLDELGTSGLCNDIPTSWVC